MMLFIWISLNHRLRLDVRLLRTQKSLKVISRQIFQAPVATSVCYLSTVGKFTSEFSIWELHVESLNLRLQTFQYKMILRAKLEIKNEKF